MQVLDVSKDGAIERAAALIRGGGLVGMPTETVYGLATDATDGEAVARVFAVKGRPSFDPLIVHTAEVDGAWRVVAGAADWPASWSGSGRGRGVVMGLAERLAGAFWPGPLTMVLPVRGLAVSGLVTAGLGTVGLRVPGHAVSRRLIEAAGVPLAAPSANRFGGVSPTRASHVVEEFRDAEGVVLDGGACERGLESTVVGFGGEAGGSGVVLEVLRLGSVPVERLLAVAERWGCGVRVGRGTSRPSGVNPAEGGAPPAPGMLDRHYAPRTPMVLVDRLEAVAAGVERLRRVCGVEERSLTQRWGVLVAVRPEGGLGDTAQETLVKAAAGFFERLRRLDGAGHDGIVAVRAPDVGLGRAINDRLERASIQG